MSLTLLSAPFSAQPIQLGINVPFTEPIKAFLANLRYAVCAYNSESQSRPVIQRQLNNFSLPPSRSNTFYEAFIVKSFYPLHVSPLTVPIKAFLQTFVTQLRHLYHLFEHTEYKFFVSFGKKILF